MPSDGYALGVHDQERVLALEVARYSAKFRGRHAADLVNAECDEPLGLLAERRQRSQGS
ncbi:MAG: hypothetical protein ACRDN9_06645 [Streptosporangiaceae bacterium]